MWTNPCVSDGLQPQSLGPAAQLPPPAQHTHAPSLLQWTLHACVCVYTCVWARVYLSATALIFHPFPFQTLLHHLFLLCFHFFSNLSAVPPLHCCYASWRMQFVAWSGFGGFSATTALVCLVINCVSLYLPLVALGLVEQGWGWILGVQIDFWAHICSL